MSRSSLEHLLPLFDSTYRVLGESAPRLTNDGYAVRTYEAARALGEVALSLREDLGEVDDTSNDALQTVLRESVDGDLSGASPCTAFPRLVWVRACSCRCATRGSSLSLSEEEFAMLSEASGVVLAEMVAVGEVAKTQGPIEDEPGRTRARGLSQSLEDAGIRREFRLFPLSCLPRITSSSGGEHPLQQKRNPMAKDRIDRDDEDLVRLYLSDIGQYTLLTKDDEVHLAQTIEEGREAKAELEASENDKKIKLTPSRKQALKRAVHRGDQAERDFVQSNLRLVVSIAKKYQASGLPLLDLIQEGNLGLMHAVEKFDWRKGFKFSTYATWWIRQAITRGIANTGRTIRLPVHAGDTLARVQKAQSRLELKFGRPRPSKNSAKSARCPKTS